MRKYQKNSISFIIIVILASISFLAQHLIFKNPINTQKINVDITSILFFSGNCIFMIVLLALSLAIIFGHNYQFRRVFIIPIMSFSILFYIGLGIISYLIVSSLDGSLDFIYNQIFDSTTLASAKPDIFTGLLTTSYFLMLASGIIPLVMKCTIHFDGNSKLK